TTSGSVLMTSATETSSRRPRTSLRVRLVAHEGWAPPIARLERIPTSRSPWTTTAWGAPCRARRRPAAPSLTAGGRTGGGVRGQSDTRKRGLHPGLSIGPDDEHRARGALDELLRQAWPQEAPAGPATHDDQVRCEAGRRAANDGRGIARHDQTPDLETRLARHERAELTERPVALLAARPVQHLPRHAWSKGPMAQWIEDRTDATGKGLADAGLVRHAVAVRARLRSRRSSPSPVRRSRPPSRAPPSSR